MSYHVSERVSDRYVIRVGIQAVVVVRLGWLFWLVGGPLRWLFGCLLWYAPGSFPRWPCCPLVHFPGSRCRPLPTRCLYLWTRIPVGSAAA